MKMRTAAFILLLALSVVQAMVGHAQAPQHHDPAALDRSESCGSTAVRERVEQDPALREERRRIEQDLYRIISGHGSRNGGTRRLQRGVVYTIPVVVHIIHQDGPENISDDQVREGIRNLNDAFRNAGPYQQPFGVDMEIEFCLAKQDEHGAFTTGITRTRSELTEMVSERDDATLKNLSRWNPENYLNIWLVREITSSSSGPGISGYAYPLSARGGAHDGIVNEARLFGGTTDQAKIHIHEAGHYLGLYHTFDGGCDNSDCLRYGDYICDTPPDATSSSPSCDLSVNSCTSDAADLSANNPFRPVSLGGVGDQPDMSNNYMDYGLQSCLNAFTEGQRLRMIAVLTEKRAGLLESQGCVTTCRSSITAGFTSSATLVDAGTAVTFTNTSIGATAFEWRADGASFSGQRDAQRTFPTQGTYIITLTASNGDSACTQIHADTIVVVCPLKASFTASATTIPPGGTVLFTSTSIGALRTEWFVDGTPIGTTPQIAHTFPFDGGYQVYLVTYNGICHDTSALQIRVGDCRGTKEGNVWYFGTNAGVDFNSGSPVAVGGLKHFLREGIANICDRQGRMLMYTDGDKVWDRTGGVMLNGDSLGGSDWSAQSSLIVPAPRSESLYYIFTTSNWTDPSPALRYSVVDITRAGGLGEVITKGVLLGANISERLAAVFHADCEDIWIVSHEMYNDLFLAFRLTADGVEPAPVRSWVGSRANGPNRYGMLKFSPNGLRLASAFGGQSSLPTLEIFDFDPATGIVSNPLVLTDDNNRMVNAYSCEFSPNNALLYAAGIGEAYIYQYDLLAGDGDAIRKSRYRVVLGTEPKATLQLGPDGRIYVGKPNLSTLGAILTPNVRGNGCNYQGVVVNLGKGMSHVGLPGRIAGYTTTKLAIEGSTLVCSNAGDVIFRAHGGWCSHGRHLWSVEGPAVIDSTPHGDASLRFTGSGQVTLLLDNRGDCGSMYDTMRIVVVPAPRVELGDDRALCPRDVIVLDAGAGMSSYRWSDGSSGQTLRVTTGGVYWVEVANAAGCTARDTIVLAEDHASPFLSLGRDTSVCDGEIVVLDAGEGYTSYQWQDGSAERRFTPVGPGTYWVTVTRACGAPLSDTITIVSGMAPGGFLGPDRTFCDGDTVTLGTPIARMRYLWSTGDTTPTIRAYAPGLYWVRASNLICSASDTIWLAAVERRYTIWLPDRSGTPVEPGEDVVLPLRLTGGGGAALEPGVPISCRVRYNRTLLHPVGGTPAGTISGGERVLWLTGTTDGSDTLLLLRFQALLGDEPVTSLTIDMIDLPAPCPPLIQATDGRVAIAGCAAGPGSRLVGAAGAPKLVIRSLGQGEGGIEIGYELIEDGFTRLVLVDALGRIVATLAEGAIDPGSHTVWYDAAGLPSGTYFLQLRTPTRTITETLPIRR